MNENPTIDVHKVRPITRFIYTLGALPTSYLMSMTYEEQLTWLCNYIAQTLIPAINTDVEAVQELQQLYIDLQNYVNNYFDNLDVQEEINNKLDEMLENGDLEQIIEQFVQSSTIWSFNTVNDMQESTNLIIGSYARTLGYYAINDEGSSLYYITNEVIESAYQITLDSGLYATLVIENDTVNVNQFGAKGDGETDDTDNLQLALNSGAGTIKFGHNLTYMVRGYNTGDTPVGGGNAHGISVLSNTVIDLNFATLKVISNSRDNYKILYIDNKENIVVKNGFILGDNATHDGTSGEWGHGLVIKDSSNIIVENVNASLCWGDGFNIQSDGEYENSYITFKDCIADDNRRQGLSISGGLHDGYFENCEFLRTGTTSRTNPSAGVDLEPELGQKCRNITFFNCKFRENHGAGIEIRDSYDLTLDNCLIDKNTGDGSERIIFISDDSYNIYVKNSYIDQTGFRKISQIDCNGNTYFENNTFKDGLLMIRLISTTKSLVNISNCKFILTLDSQWNSCISVNEARNEITEDNESEVFIDNCYFEFRASILREWIRAQENNHFGKITISNNKFVKGRCAIHNAYTNSNISNNEFVQIMYQTMNLSGSSNTHSVINNLFEQCNYNTTTNSLISNNATTNFILKDNTYINRTLNNVINIDNPAHSPSKWLENTSTASIMIDKNNDIENI